MAQARSRLVDQLVEVVQSLPEEKIVEVLDFAADLRGASGESDPERGSADAILTAIEKHGPLEFEPNELESILADIDRLRHLDLRDRGATALRH
ncbi:MAG TPA: hypothetical protein VMM78_06510 [Thermomicrobiales bacterium]|nr:hypothetical protein [Thermomicrobiales bacterium]